MTDKIPGAAVVLLYSYAVRAVLANADGDRAGVMSALTDIESILGAEARRKALPEGAEGYAEFIMTVLNRVIGDADEAGQSVRLRYRDAGVVDRSGDRLEGIEWVTASGQEYSIEEMDVVSITGAAQLLGMSRSALRARVFRAHRAGKTTPFFWSKASKIWLATPASVKTWAASRTRVVR